MSEVFGISPYNGQEVKNHIMNHFNAVLKRNGWDNCHDSTSALSTGFSHFTKGNKTNFKIDLAIVRENRYGWERLIHRKTGFVAFDQWYWNEDTYSRD